MPGIPGPSAISAIIARLRSLWRGLFLLPAVSALVLAVGLVAALGPARRVLAVQPTEALREE